VPMSGPMTVPNDQVTDINGIALDSLVESVISANTDCTTLYAAQYETNCRETELALYFRIVPQL
jgi:hypothetical protein